MKWARVDVHGRQAMGGRKERERTRPLLLLKGHRERKRKGGEAFFLLQKGHISDKKVKGKGGFFIVMDTLCY